MLRKQSTAIYLQNSLTVMTIKKRVETSFEEDEFLEGAKDAWFAGQLSCVITQLKLEVCACSNHLPMLNMFHHAAHAPDLFCTVARVCHPVWQ